MNKKYIIIIIVIISSILLLIMLTINYTSSNNGVSGDYKDVAISNNWASEDDYRECDSNLPACIELSYQLISSGLNKELDLLELWNEGLPNKLTEINALIGNKEYKKSLLLTKELVSSEKKLTKSRNDDISEALKELGDAGYKTKENSYGYTFRDGWLMIKIESKNNSVDPIYTILEKKYSDWKITIPGGTGFTEDELSQAGVPGDFIDILTGRNPVPSNVVGY